MHSIVSQTPSEASNFLSPELLANELVAVNEQHLQYLMFDKSLDRIVIIVPCFFTFACFDSKMQHPKQCTTHIQKRDYINDISYWKKSAQVSSVDMNQRLMTKT